jgi:hypothetical protein
MATNPKSVEKLEAVLANLKVQAKEAHDEEDILLMSALTEMIGVVSPIVTKAIARQHREQRAKINAAHKKLRAKVRDQGNSSSDDDAFPSDD